MDATTIVGMAAFALSAVQVVHMARSILTTSDPTGVSVGTWLLLLAQGIAWVTFGWAERLWPSFGINVLLVAMAVPVINKLCSRPRFTFIVGAALAASTCCALLVAAGHAAAVGWLAAACGLVALVPQAVTLARTRDTAGLSLGSWTIGLAGITCWLVYGIGKNTNQIVYSSIPPLLCSSIIVAALLRGRITAIEVTPA